MTESTIENGDRRTMRVCFMVLAHYDPEGCARLVSELSTDGDHVVVHIDSKADQRRFLQVLPSSPLVTYEPERVDVKWGSSSIMAAQANMMRTAVAVAPDADYFWLVSGDTFPTQSVVDLKRYLAATHPAEFLNIVPMPADHLDKPIYRLSHYRLDFDARSDRLRLAYMALNRLAVRPGWRRHLNGMQPYGGSSWFTLTREAVDHILGYLDAHPRFWRFALTSGAPDEWLPHTVLANAPALRDRIRGALFWADFRESTPPPRPPALGDEQVELLKELLVTPRSGFPDPGLPLMVRKCGTDARIIERIRTELWSMSVS